jgi:hypothetical protein
LSGPGSSGAGAIARIFNNVSSARNRIAIGWTDWIDPKVAALGLIVQGLLLEQDSTGRYSIFKVVRVGILRRRIPLRGASDSFK